MVKHRTKQLDNAFRKQLYKIGKALEEYHKVQVFDTHTDKDPNDTFNNVYEDNDVRIIFNYVYDYIEILTDNLCLKGEILYKFTELDPETNCCIII